MNISGTTVSKGKKMEKDKNKTPDVILNKKLRENSLDKNIVPFETTEEAWFWFVLAQQAKMDGARYSAGLSLTPRPCEPSDILKILNNLYRNRMLLWDHLLVLRHYGRRQLAPDATRVKEVKAHKLWHEAMQRLEPVLIRKNIMIAPPKNLFAQKAWAQEAMLYTNTSQDNRI